MTFVKAASIFFILLTTCFINELSAADAPSQTSGKQNGPPPEAYTACKDKSAGDTAELTTSRGDKISGTCVQQGNKLVLRPDRPKGGQKKSPPPEAYAACKGKSAGDTAELTSPRGDKITGTCQQDGDLLVLRPDRPRSKSAKPTGKADK